MRSIFPYEAARGKAKPYGVSFHEDGVNFSLFSKHAKKVTILLYSTDEKLLFSVPVEHKTGDVWHVLVKGLPRDLLYAYQINGSSPLLDPYAKAVVSKSPYAPLGVVDPSPPFDWGKDKHPNIPLSDLILYEMHVRGFTMHASSGVKNKGTFLGVIEKIPHLLELGVNAIELMPTHEFNEHEYKRQNPLTQKQLVNYWGYSTVNFFALKGLYAHSPSSSITEFKMMVKALHSHGIEVILDVVFNHTAEGNEKGPLLSFKGIDLETYYMLGSDGLHLNFSGCGNTFNCNHPIVIDLILDCLHYWVVDMHIDGFRFDLASIFYRDSKGHSIKTSPLVEAITHDPILSQVKLIAEPWDAGGHYCVGSFYSAGARWSEWNDKYRDVVRDFIKGTKSAREEFATRLCGSQDLYHAQSPSGSINFVTCHDGFSLADLVSYNTKHNIANGENNNDGANSNYSWNCGAEGETDDPKILALRERQMKNLLVALLVSQGIPMLLMGDEYGHTKNGNNNTWCQDNDLNWFDWEGLKQNQEFYRFYRNMIHFRKQHSILHRDRFLTTEDVHWHGASPFHPHWKTESGFLALTLTEPQGNDLYIAFNAQDQETVATLPPPPTGKLWSVAVDTAEKAPGDFPNSSDRHRLHSKTFVLLPYSSVIFLAIS